jgi:hypothetical protein
MQQLDLKLWDLKLASAPPIARKIVSSGAGMATTYARLPVVDKRLVPAN